MFYVTFIITNTYGKDVDLTTGLSSPFDKFTILNGKTVRMSIELPTQQVAAFEAFVRKTGEKIKINDLDVVRIQARNNRDEVNELQLPEVVGMYFLKYFLYINCIFVISAFPDMVDGLLNNY